MCMLNRGTGLVLASTSRDVNILILPPGRHPWVRGLRVGSLADTAMAGCGGARCASCAIEPAGVLVHRNGLLALLTLVMILAVCSAIPATTPHFANVFKTKWPICNETVPFLLVSYCSPCICTVFAHKQLVYIVS